MAWYYISLGSNIDPYENVKYMLDYLLQISKRIDISRILETQAKGFNSDRTFLNLAARIQTHLSPVELKELFNQIETKLGRDRNDPQSKKKDRVADIDILFYKEHENNAIYKGDLPPEPYVRPFVLELLDYLKVSIDEQPQFKKFGVSLNFHNIIIGHQALSIRIQEENIIKLSMPMKAAG
ncbi:MAG: 2-amino-4-hydroxy-6-hydroxymethyldihydropteridine diphosphokinase [Saprospiraceae bacterium]|nr:2-amino-4-hydroxy-6-hydroxymethyldihydropteridine diphosphokinase [Saprospiraceae bacterium]